MMSREWFYMSAGQKHGPFEESELKSKLVRGDIRFDVLVWSEGMSGWKKVQDIPDFKDVERSLPKAVIPAKKIPPKPVEQAAGPVTGSATESQESSPGARIPERRESRRRSKPQTGSPYVPNYLVHAIFCTICCCLPFGIAGILYATKVETYVRLGMMDAAWDASNKARMYCLTSIISSVVVFALYFLIGFAQL
ncbi:hypothetical protein Rhal01_01550 [Rubritalea halochordaticola]|uniref:GYF domain-containing protein n=2 Tax=Rubritalea halochordaticola TaxID=714537 RepID=A0ABP9UY91_9BACT